MTLSVRLLFLACLLGSALNQAAAQENSYRLQPGDTVEISVDLDPSLKGQYVVGPDGNMTMPLAGHVEASGLTLPELETSLEKHLQPNFKTEPGVTAALISSQAGSLAMTVFLAGDVAKPGEYPFRRGMTVLHALSLAGGPYRPLSALAQIDPALAEDSALTLKRRLAVSMLRSARLGAELANRAAVEQPSEVAQWMTDPVIAHAARQEDLLFETRRSAKQRDADARQRAELALEAQISALKAQLDLNKKQMMLAQKEQASGKTLIDQGLSPALKGLAMERSIAEIDAARVQIESDLTTAENNLAGAKSDDAALAQEWRIQILADQEQADALVEEFRRIINGADGNTGKGSTGSPEQTAKAENAYTYTVVRMVNGTLTETEIGELDPIQPGDLIKVVTKHTPLSTTISSVGGIGRFAGESGTSGTEQEALPSGTTPSN